MFFSFYLSTHIYIDLTVVVLRMMSTSSLSSGTTSSTKRGMVGTTGGGLINAAFLALKRKLKITEKPLLKMLNYNYCIPYSKHAAV